MREPVRKASTLPYGGLGRAHLTKHLLVLAQRVGVDKVTMRALAAEASTSASSLYYHIKDKEEMLDLLIEAVISSIEVPGSGHWRAKLVTLHSNAWAALVGVPGIGALLQQRPFTEAAANMDRSAREILSESGLSEPELGLAHAVLYIHLLGSVELQHRCGRTSEDSDDARAVFAYGLEVIVNGLFPPGAVNRKR